MLMSFYSLSGHSPGRVHSDGRAGVNSRPGQGPAARVSGVLCDCECECASVSRAFSSGMCSAGSGCARIDMKMRSGKVVPLCSINQGGKEKGCARHSLETGRGRGREREEGKRGRREGEREEGGGKGGEKLGVDSARRV